MITVAATTIAALEATPNIRAILAEYAAESAIEGMPPPSAKVETYRALEAAGLLHTFAASLPGELVGYITVLATPLPHYSATIAVAESFFVAAAHRKTGAGLKLLHCAETRARELGSPVLLVSAPFEGRLFEVLPRVGYAECSRVFCKRLADG